MSRLTAGLLGVVLLAALAPALATDAPLKLRVDGLACAYCAYGIEKAFMQTPGVRHVVIDFENGYVLIDKSASTRFDDATLRRIVNDAGFTLRGIERPGAP